MKNNKTKNQIIGNIEIFNTSYCINIHNTTKKFDNANDCFLSLHNRKNHEKLTLPLGTITHTDNLTILKGYFEFEKHKDFMLEDGIWDLYLSGNGDEELIDVRVKSSDEFFEFQYFEDPIAGKMISPYTTKGGNLSFRVSDLRLITTVKEFELKKDGQLALEVMFDSPLLKKNDIHAVNLLVSVEDEEHTIPLEVSHPESTKTPYLATGAFNPIEFLNTSNKLYFKFHLAVDTGHKEKLFSNRLKCDHHTAHVSKQSVKITDNNQKYKLLCKPTKRSKYLSFQVAEYYFWKELKKSVRKKWVEIRRGGVAQKAYKVALKMVGFLPVDKRLVIFESFSGKQYSDNPRAIYEYMQEHYPTYKMYWSADRRNLHKFEGKDVIAIRRFSIKWLFLMARARYWVTNSRLPLWIPKPGHTTYVQTWHGTPLKRLAADMEEVHMPGTNTEKYKRNFLKEASKWDYLISPNRYSTEIFKRAFGFTKTVIESGYPRNDYLYTANNLEMIEELKNRLGLPPEKKVILYAPTWRDNQFYRKGKYMFKLQLDLDQLQVELGDEYIIILRMHYLVAESIDLTPYDGFAYDFSNHEDIRDLYLISDLLITDYSSVFFDYANLKRPCIFFVYDIEEYRDSLRGFYFNFEAKAPGLLAKTTDEIIKEINRLEASDFQLSEKFEEFYERFCYLEDGEAAKRVVDVVLENNHEVKLTKEGSFYEINRNSHNRTI